MTRQTSHPGLHRVEIFDFRNEAHAIHDLLNGPRLFRRGLLILIPHRDRQREIAERAVIAAKFLQRIIHIFRFVQAVGILQLAIPVW
jgi:hypothetical protein